MRSSASLAIGEAVAAWTSKNLRRTCAQQAASTILSAGEQLVEPGIAVGVDDAAEVLQMGLRMLALAIGRVEEQRRRRPRTGKRPLVADVGPQPAGLGLAGARRQDRHRGVVDMQAVAGEDVGGERIDERLQRRRRRADPAGQGRGLQAHPVAGEDLGLAIQRQVVVVLRHDDMSQQTRPGAAAGDRVIGRRRRNHRIAGPAGQFLAEVPDHLEAARHVIEGLGDLLADPAQRAAADGASARRGMSDILSGQVFRQPAARRLVRFDCGLDHRPPQWRAARPGRFPRFRSPARAAPPRAPPSPTSDQTRPADSAPAGTSAWRSGPQRRRHPAPLPQ